MHPAIYNRRREAGTGKLASFVHEQTSDQTTDQGTERSESSCGPRAPPLSMDSFIWEPECRAVTGLSRVTRWRLERAGLFPRRRRLSFGATGWLRSEICDWIVSRQAA